MDFLIADSFTDSLARLTGEEQKAVKTTAFDLQLDPTRPGMSLHKVDRARDHNFWSVRVNRDLRLIVHRTEASMLLCYVAHHDPAYEWAERRRLETHPRTGAAQMVVIRETVQEVLVPHYVEEEQPKIHAAAAPLFENLSNDELLGYGVPQEWLSDVKGVTENGLLALADHLPAEAAEALLELATGGTPRVPEALPEAGPFEHPDAQRRFRVMTNIEELERALDFPWEQWTIFMHPEQRQLVERDYSGPARVSGSAGTGKTVVALHRAAYLARTHPESRVLLATFSEALAGSLRTKLLRLLGNEPHTLERIDVHSLPALGRRLHRSLIGPVELAGPAAIRDLVIQAAESIEGHRFRTNFLVGEFEQVVDAWQLDSWDAYRDVVRLGRRTRLPEARRAVLWSIFELVRAGLRRTGLVTESGMFNTLAEAIAGRDKVIFDFAVVDEAQDLSPAHLKFFSALGGGRANSLFFAGDLGQRIFQQPFSWSPLGVETRGRSRTLRVNYRTSHQIRTQADRLLGPTVADVDGNTENRSDTVSVFNGPSPEVRLAEDAPEEVRVAGEWLAARASEGLSPREFGVFVRSDAQLDRAKQAIQSAGMRWKLLGDTVEPAAGHVSLSTMHLAKGLEFRAVVVMACDDDVVPLQERLESVGDEADLKDTYETERHLLYVACTRARDHLLVTGVKPGSEFLADMMRSDWR